MMYQVLMFLVVIFTVTIVSDGQMVDSKAKQYIDKMINEHPVMVFSKPGCPYCKMAKEVLNSVGVVYFVEEIDSRPDYTQLQDVFLQMTGEKTVPRVYIRGRCIGGGTMTDTLNKEGKLITLLKQAGAKFKAYGT